MKKLIRRKEQASKKPSQKASSRPHTAASSSRVAQAAKHVSAQFGRAIVRLSDR
jgi:hypothetical protein